MENELNSLENKIAQVVALCQALHADNQQLYQRIASIEGENARLRERMDTARERLEALAGTLPDLPES